MKNEKNILNSEEFKKEKIDFSEIDNEQNYEKALKIEASKLLKAKQQAQMADMRDNQYYCVLVFCNKNDRDAFIKQIDSEIEIQANTFIDGYEFAEKYHKPITMSANLPEPYFSQAVKVKKINKKLKLK